MKTITLQLYTFDELSDEVQKEIIERERWNIMEQCMEGYGSDYVTALRAFEKLTNTQSYSWSVNYSGILNVVITQFLNVQLIVIMTFTQRICVGSYCSDISIIILCHTLRMANIIQLQVSV